MALAGTFGYVSTIEVGSATLGETAPSPVLAAVEVLARDALPDMKPSWNGRPSMSWMARRKS